MYSFIQEFPLNYNPAIKPLSRLEITRLLSSLDTSDLSPRQQKELEFYQRNFNNELTTNKKFFTQSNFFHYRDSSFSLTINPIMGGNSWINKNSFEYHWWNGAEAAATLGNWSFYANMRDNHLSSKIFSPAYLDQQPAGSNFKVASDGKIDFEEIRGGVTYAWNTGHVGLVKDNFEWGTNYHGANIFSGHTPAFVHLDLQIKPVKWFEFNYTHAWLNSEVIDSSRTFTVSNAYGTTGREFYHSKFMAANMFSFFPVQNLSISLGNSIIYDYDNVHPAYLIPVMFFKAIDHSLTAGIQNMNSQMFFDISSKNINHLHLYSTLFIDELAIDRIRTKDEHNFASLKAGLRVSNLIPDFFGGVEYTITNALTFKHFVPTTTFESNHYNLGHYLTDNAKELFLNLGWKPVRNMVIEISYTDIIKGPDHSSLGTMPREGITPFVPVVFESRSLELNASWQIINNLHVRLGLIHRTVSGDSAYLIQYSPEFWWGTTNTLNLGVNFGF
ncbi:MAG: hypothetical protein H6540_05405 [Bacteroidales bacterium]|nr:hypothetical protein [Bacteroidales bacterium]